MKTILAFVILLVSTSVLAGNPQSQNAYDNANCHASFQDGCEETVTVASVPEPGMLGLLGLGVLSLVAGRVAVKRTRKP